MPENCDLVPSEQRSFHSLYHALDENTPIFYIRDHSFYRGEVMRFAITDDNRTDHPGIHINVTCVEAGRSAYSPWYF